MVVISNLVQYDNLLKNETDIITNCDSYFITKCNESLLQNVMVLLQNTTVVTKCDVYYKMRQDKVYGINR